MKRWSLAVLGVTAVVLGALLIFARPGAAPAPGPPEPTPAVGLLLVQLRDATGYATANVILGSPPATDDSVRGSDGLLQVPASLLLTVDDDSVTLGQAAQLPDTLASVTGVTDGLGIPLDAGLILDRLALAGLVDGVRGVWVKVPETTPLRTHSPSPDPVRVVGPGWELMDGITAADYALTRLPGEPESARTDRFQAVLVAALGRLPVSEERLAQLLSSLGALAQPTVPSGALVDPLLRARHAVRSDSLDTGRLPVLVIRDGIRPASLPGPGWSAEVTRVLGVVPS